MLNGINPLLSPDLLFVLHSMGHGDEIVIADANFPAASCNARALRLDGVSATDALRAVLSVFPLDTFVEAPANTMQVVGDPTDVPDAVAEFRNIVKEVADNPADVGTIERFDFYERTKSAYAVVQTGETRLYGNIILTKGVVIS